MEELMKILEDIVPDADCSSSEHLVDDGILTSFELVMLVAQIGETFGIAIPSEDITPENFNSADAIFRLIERLKEDE